MCKKPKMPPMPEMPLPRAEERLPDRAAARQAVSPGVVGSVSRSNNPAARIMSNDTTQGRSQLRNVGGILGMVLPGSRMRNTLSTILGG